MKKSFWCWFIAAIIISVKTGSVTGTRTGFEEEQLSVYPVLMPRVVPSHDEVYLCTVVDVSAADSAFWVRGFEPRASMRNVHHMALAGCKDKPDKTRFNIWNCGANGNPILDENYPVLPVCPGGKVGDDTSIYLWSRNGSRIMLPEGVGFKMGKDTRIQFLVLQVHYLNVHEISRNSNGDTSGVYLYYTRTPQPKIAGMLSLHVNTRVPAMSRSFQEAACRIEENKPIHPFAYLVHTHHHGQVVSFWKVRRNLVGTDEWTLLGKRDPVLERQSFYPIEDSGRIYYGDSVALRCTMVNLTPTEVRQGLASYDEMCDVYMMYWADPGDDEDQENYLLQGANFCWSSGPPNVSWQALGLNNIPNVQASKL